MQPREEFFRMISKRVIAPCLKKQGEESPDTSVFALSIIGGKGRKAIVANGNPAPILPLAESEQRESATETILSPLRRGER